MQKKHPKLYFAIMFSLFVLFSVGVPIGYILIRHKPFMHLDKITIGFWELLAILVLLIFVNIMIKYYMDGMKTKYNFLKKVVSGISKVILPLTVLFLILFFLKDYTKYIIEFLFVLIPSEFVAICVNPLPKWAFDNNVSGLGDILDKVIPTDMRRR